MAGTLLGALMDRWLAWRRSPAGVSLRTKRRYAPRSVDRYAVSWEGFFAVLPQGRAAGGTWRAWRPVQMVFAGEAQVYGKVRRTWAAICRAAEIAGATPHDARHTFAVHAAQGGPIGRLQKMLGHADATMTMRYMKHAPEAYLDEDAAAIVERMTGPADAETAARVEAARRGLKPA